MFEAIKNKKGKIHCAVKKAMSVFRDTSGANRTTEILVGIAVAIVIGMLLLSTATGYFSSTFWPSITSKISGIFS
jgi:uncharacterized membrane protein YgaE (UPF0421/DUF939 family)